MRVQATLTEKLPGAPVTRDQLTMLELGDNVVTSPDAVETFKLPLVPLDEQLRRARRDARPRLRGGRRRPAVEEITLDPPGADEVQVRVEACGVCHTDLHVVETGGWGCGSRSCSATRAPGVVEEVGDGVTASRRATAS